MIYYVLVGHKYRIHSRNSALVQNYSNYELSHNELEDVALSSLQPRYHVLVFTVDVTQLLGFVISSGGAHSFRPCSVHFLEHSGCFGGSPGALYLNNMILYIDIYII